MLRSVKYTMMELLTVDCHTLQWLLHRKDKFAVSRAIRDTMIRIHIDLNKTENKCHKLQLLI